MAGDSLSLSIFYQIHRLVSSDEKQQKELMELLRMAPSQRHDMSGHTRRRISRACDQCNQLRTKCDGQNPCAHCLGE